MEKNVLLIQKIIWKFKAKSREFEISRTIHLDNERSEQFFPTESFLNL